MILTADLPPNQAAALAEACRRFQYGDAQHLLRHARNIEADSLCEAMTSLLDALTLAGREEQPAMPIPAASSSPIAVTESETRVTIKFEIEKTDLAKHREALENLLAASAPRGSP